VRGALVAGVVLWAGTTLLLSELRWFRRRTLADRLRPYSPGAGTARGTGGALSVGSFREVVGPVASALGARAARVAGVGEDLATRLERIHAEVDPTAFRVRQLTWAIAGFGTASMVAAAVRPPTALGLLFVLGAPVLAFLVLEQRLAERSADWQRRLFLELPVVAEQLGMLLSAGYSLGGALNRLAARGRGTCGRDLARVCARVRQGLSEVDALREWSTVAAVPAVDRLVSVLALNREAGDLGRLITDEARNVRREVHRQLLASIDRRSQQVWIPVTVAALVPGVLFLPVPFIEALTVFSGT
jgi:Flp pilus assembly protein TadB